MPFETIIALIGRYTVRVIGAILLLWAVWMVASWCRRITSRMFERAEFDPTLSRFFSKAAHTAVIVLGVISCLGIFGVNTTSVAAVLAAAGFAVGLAFQGTLSNFSAGIMLLAFRPFKVGDFVSVAGTLGTVYEIELFTTALDTPDNRRLIIPNSTVFSGTIENITFHPKRRVDVNVGVDYSADIDTTREVLERAARNVTNRLEDEDVQVVLMDLGASSVNWQVRVWTATSDFLAAKDNLTQNIKTALDEAGISIPFQQLDVHHYGLSNQDIAGK